MTDKADKQQSFEKSLSRLEKIVDEMESGELSLDRMIKHFEEGTTLVKTCNDRLNEVEKKIEQLVKNGDQLSTAPLDEEEDES